MKALIIIPAYNEAENICKVVDNIVRNFPQYDYVVINDASTDSMGEILKEKSYCYLDQPINLGIGGTVQNGYQYARDNGYDVAVQLDGDGQHDVKYLETMLQKIENDEADIVIGSRFLEKEGFQSSFLRRTGIAILSMIIKLCTWKRIKDFTSGVRAVNRRCSNIYAKDDPQDYPEL